MRNSGFRGPWDSTAFRFDNGYYRALLDLRWDFDGTQFNEASGEGTMMLPSDMTLVEETGFAVWTSLFARDVQLWRSTFSQAFSKLSELGHDPALLTMADFELPSRTAGKSMLPSFPQLLATCSSPQPFSRAHPSRVLLQCCSVTSRGGDDSGALDSRGGSAAPSGAFSCPAGLERCCHLCAGITWHSIHPLACL